MKVPLLHSTLFISHVHTNGLSTRYVVSMKNGDLDAKGLLALVVKETGSLDDFKVTVQLRLSLFIIPLLLYERSQAPVVRNCRIYWRKII